MTLPVAQFFTSRTVLGTQNIKRPMITSLPITFGGSNISTLRGTYHDFWKWFKRTPELVATIGVPVTDIMGDRPHWTDLDGNELNKKELKEATAFWRGNRGKETITAWLYDRFLTGDSFLWVGKPTSKDVVRAVKEVLKKDHSTVRISTKEIKQVLVKAAVKISQDEDLKKPKVFDYVASSTVDIIHTPFEILHYRQIVNGNQATFQPDEIIHGRYITINGEVQGFSPVESLMAELTLLNLVKGNMLAFMRNGGSPDKAYILPKEIANSPNHQFLVSTLQKYKKIENAHGNLVFTGEIDIKDLQGNPKDLEYKDLALYITSNIAYAYGIPVTRIPYLIGTAQSKGDSGGLSESGYWNKISEIQDDVEDLLNGQLFLPFGWQIHLPRKYKQDEVREAQTASMNTDTVIKMQKILKENKLQLNNQKILRLLQMSTDDVEDFEPGIEEENELQNQNQLPNSQVMTEPDQQKRANTKRNSANQKGTESASVPGS